MIEISPETVVYIIQHCRAEDDLRLRSAIGDLNADEQAHLTALAWVGRGAFDADDYAEAVQTALDEASVPTEDYLMGMPHLAEHLEAGLEAMGYDVSELEQEFL